MLNMSKTIVLCSVFVLLVSLCLAEAAESDLPTGSEQVSFIELGSVKCIPCKKMQPIIDEIENEYAGKVKVVFYDVWTDAGRASGNEYGVRMIPTQVFLDREGNEIFRHQGFLPKSKIEQVLSDNGVTR